LSHYLFVTFPIVDIEKLTRQTTGYEETRIINIKRNIRIEIRIELEEFSSVDLSLTTQDGFEISPQHLVIYHISSDNTETNEHVSSMHTNLAKSFSHFSIVSTNNEKQTSHFYIAEEKMAKPGVYVTETKPNWANFIYSTVMSNVFRMNIICDAEDNHNECQMKSVEIQALQLVSFKEPCWLLKEYDSELNLYLVKHTDRVRFILFLINTETMLEQFLCTADIVGDVETSVRTFLVEFETMFILSHKRNHQLALRPRKKVPETSRFILVQAESVIRPVWYLDVESCQSEPAILQARTIAVCRIDWE